MAECGTCSLCCKVLGISDLTPPKPPGKWCSYAKPGSDRACTIYEQRPASCRDFECGWLANDGAPELRPDRIHLTITGESKKMDAYIVHVDPGYPGAENSEPARIMLQNLMQHGRYKNAIIVTGERRRFIGNDTTKVQRLLDNLPANLTVLD